LPHFGEKRRSSFQSSNVSFATFQWKETFELSELDVSLLPHFSEKRRSSVQSSMCLFCHISVKRHVRALSLSSFKAQSSQLECLFCHISVKRDVRALSLNFQKVFENVTPDGIGCTCNVCCSVLWMYTFIHRGCIAIHDYHERMYTFTMVNSLCIAMYCECIYSFMVDVCCVFAPRGWGLMAGYSWYGVAATGRLLKITGLFCKRDL